MSELETETKIKEAARKIFQEKGFAGAKTRDIAAAAGINLALLNYYFRSKKKLFDIIAFETLQSFFSGIMKILNDEHSTLKEKISHFVEEYIDMLSENPNIISFMLNTIREDPETFISNIGMLDQAKHSFFIKQFVEAVQKGHIAAINPIHFMMNLMSLVAFPFVASPMILAVSGVEKKQYFEMIQERKRLIPLWIEAMVKIE